MPHPGKLSDLEERILFALWKLGGIGKNAIQEERLKTGLAIEASSQIWMSELENLRKQGFLEANSMDGRNVVSLTPLGLSILRQIEEDRLQELK